VKLRSAVMNGGGCFFDTQNKQSRDKFCTKQIGPV
jgi:hypothetical protein